MKKRAPRVKYDVFICHAGEDKVKFVRPLAEELRMFGARVWYDEFTLSVGDSLSRSIDRGLARSAYGLVVLSPAFLKKAWPEYELTGLVAKEVGKKKVILPIWYGITKTKLIKYSPPLADKYALDAQKFRPIDLAAEIIGIVRPDLYEKVQRRVAFVRAVRHGKTTRRPAKKIKVGPPRHESLPMDLVGRIRLIRAVLLSVCPHSMKFWIHGFRSDFHPSNEIRIWERVAACFMEYTSMTSLSSTQRKTVFKVFLALSCGITMNELQKELAELPDGASSKIELLRKYSVPVFDLRDDPFPKEYEMSAEDEKRFKEIDSETFPTDFPPELIERLLSKSEISQGQR